MSIITFPIIPFQTLSHPPLNPLLNSPKFFPFHSSLNHLSNPQFQLGFCVKSSPFSPSCFTNKGNSHGSIEVLRVPDHWLEPSNAIQKTTDLGEILLKMARELESISYQESFHGAFSSANAAVSLIAERIELD